MESIERRRDDMISALWANSNYDDDKGTRRQAITEIEANFQEAIDMIHGVAPEEEEIDKDNPFFSAVDRGQQKIQQAVNPDGTVQEVVAENNEYSRYIDQ